MLPPWKPAVVARGNATIGVGDTAHPNGGYCEIAGWGACGKGWRGSIVIVEAGDEVAEVRVRPRVSAADALQFEDSLLRGMKFAIGVCWARRS